MSTMLWTGILVAGMTFHVNVTSSERKNLTVGEGADPAGSLGKRLSLRRFQCRHFGGTNLMLTGEITHEGAG